MVLVGVAWASILSMPYAMLSNAIPAAKMGFYMGVFNFFIVLPQILASAGLGSLMKTLLGDNPMNAVLLGGCSMVLAGALRRASCLEERGRRAATDANVIPSKNRPVSLCPLSQPSAAVPCPVRSPPWPTRPTSSKSSRPTGGSGIPGTRSGC